MFVSRFMPCLVCGASVDRADLPGHGCAPERRADYQLFQLRHEVAELEAAVRRFLDAPAGRFESWSAARHVRHLA